MNSELESEQAIFTLYAVARRRTVELERQIAASARYITELEKQLEPEVIQEIRTALSSEKDLAAG